jgi:hypothetical protein
MSEGRKSRRGRLRRPAVQEELPLPPPPGPPIPVEEIVLEWWQTPRAVLALAAISVALLALAVASHVQARRDDAAVAEAKARLKTLTLRAPTAERALRITPNPQSWSATPDAVIGWPEPPVLLEIYFPVAYSEFTTFAVTVDKVDQGRMLIAQRLVPDSNRDLRLAINSSAFGPGEYRIRIEGYNWRGQRSDAGWVRLVVR